jgi:hypothetical protein
MSTEHRVQNFVGGEVCLWIEQDASIHLKAVSPYGDPVELTADSEREIAAALHSAAAQLEATDDSPRQ